VKGEKKKKGEREKCEYFFDGECKKIYWNLNNEMKKTEYSVFVSMQGSHVKAVR